MDEMKKMKVSDRLVLLHTLPKEGDIITVRVLRELKMDLALSEDEIRKLNVTEGQNINFNQIDNFEKDIPMGKVRKSVIKSALQKLDAEKKLTEDHVLLWDMFC
jgi:hypothetical protein